MKTGLKILISLFIFSLLVFVGFRKPALAPEVSKVKGETTSYFKELLNPVYFTPRKLTIAKIGLEAEVVSVGTEEDGSLEIPESFEKLGWFRGGAKAGEPGNLVLDGHYDDRSGRPAVFYRLKELTTGDELTLYSINQRFNYVVENIAWVAESEAAAVLSFGEKAYSKVTLITCGGVWDPVRKSYDRRLVVTGRLL